jgi:hypothetical protein
MFFYEFILYIEEVLMAKSTTAFPKAENDVKIYIENRDFLERAKSRFIQHLHDKMEWLQEEISKIYACSDISVEHFKEHYWIICEDSKWRTLDFHFELGWSDDKFLTDLKKEDDVRLVVHIEGRNNDSGKEMAALFKRKKTSSWITELHSEKISVDFSSEADAKKSIEDIVKKLKSEPYQKYARIANEYLSKQGNINKSN